MAGRKSLGSVKVKEAQIRFMREGQEDTDDIYIQGAHAYFRIENHHYSGLKMMIFHDSQISIY